MSDSCLQPGDDLHVRMLQASSDVSSFLTWPDDEIVAMVEAGLRRFTVDRDTRLGGRVGRLYPGYAERRPAAERRRLLRDLAFANEPLGPVPTPLFLWIHQDPAPEVVADATTLYAASFDGGRGEPIHGARTLEDLVLEHGTASMPGFLAGLVHLGDIHLIPMLRRLRLLCTEDEVVAFCAGPVGVPTTTEATCLLGWMEETVEAEPGRFGPLAARLAALASRAPEIIHCERPMPCSVEEALGPPPGDVVPMLDFSTWIVERLEAIAQREPEPRVMNEVLRAWGVGAVS